MNPSTPDQSPTQPPQSAVHNPLSVMQPGEQVVCSIRRHPIGVIGIYIGAGLLIIALAVLTFAVAPHFLKSVSSSQVYLIGSLIFVVVAALCFGFVLISNKVYWGNSWIVTSDSITQVTQTSLFDRQSSQLSLGNLEDVTASQDGIFAHMFNYGFLKVETAGERSKFVFPFCPDPNSYAQKILNAREQFEQGRRGDNNPQRLYRDQGTYQSGVPSPDTSAAVQTQSTTPSDLIDPSNPDAGVNVDTEA